MRRVAVTTITVALLATAGACADAGTDSRPSLAPDPRGPVPGGETTSCVESYTPDAVAGRGFAFDGVVLEVGPSVSDRGDEGDLGLPAVTFEVREWFSGGDVSTVTVDMPSPAGDLGDAADLGYPYLVGTRLLVSGEARWGGSPLDSPIAWPCGFTRFHDPASAAAWRDAITG